MVLYYIILLHEFYYGAIILEYYKLNLKLALWFVSRFAAYIIKPSEIYMYKIH